MGRRMVPTLIRFEERVQHDANASGCSLWLGCLSTGGYGIITLSKVEGGGSIPAHVFSYIQAFGPILDGLDVDHVCLVRACVRPDHLEAVTRLENLLRSDRTLASLNLAKVACPKGHPYDEINTYWYRGYRYCRACSGKRPASPREAGT